MSKTTLHTDVTASNKTGPALKGVQSNFAQLAASIRAAAAEQAKLGNLAGANAMRSLGTVIGKMGKDVQGGVTNLKNLQNAMGGTVSSSTDLINSTKLLSDIKAAYTKRLGTSAEAEKVAIRSSNDLYKALEGHQRQAAALGRYYDLNNPKIKGAALVRAVENREIQLAGASIKSLQGAGIAAMKTTRETHQAIQDNIHAHRTYNALLDRSAKHSREYRQALEQTPKTIQRNNAAMAQYGKHISDAEKFQTKWKSNLQGQRTIINGVATTLSHLTGNVTQSAMAQAAWNGHAQLSAKSFKVLNEHGLKAVGLNHQQAAAMGLLHKNYQNTELRAKNLQGAYTKLNAGLDQSIPKVRNINQQFNNGVITQAHAVRQLNLVRLNQQAVAQSSGKMGQALSFLGTRFKTFTAYTIAATSVASVLGTAMQMLSTNITHSQALKDLEAITQATTAEIGQMDEKIRQVADTTKFSAQEVAEGMRLIGQAGFSASESMEAIQAAADLATGTMTDFANSSDLLTTTIRVFQMEADQATRVADVFTNAVNNSKLTIDKIRIAMNYIGPIAHRAGVSFEDTAASMMILGNTGLRASSIATGLRRVISELVDPSDKMAAAFQRAGYTIEDLNPQVHDMRTIIGRLTNVVTDAKTAFELFGLRGATAASALATQGVPAFDKMAKAVERQGAAADNARIQMEGLGISFKNLQDKIKNMFLAMGDAGLNTVLRGFVDRARNVVTVLTEMLKMPITGYFVGAAAAILTFVGVGSVLLAFHKLWLAGIGKLIAGYKLLKIAMINTTKVMLATPAGLIATAVIGLSFALYKLITHYDNLIKKQQKLSRDAKKQIQTLEDELKTISDFNGTAEEKAKLLDRLAQTYPEVADAIYRTGGNVSHLTVLFQKLKKAQEDLELSALEDEFENLGKKLNWAQRYKSMSSAAQGMFPAIDFLLGEPGAVSNRIDKWMDSSTKQIKDRLTQVAIDLQSKGKDVDVADLIPISWNTPQNKEVLQDIIDHVQKVIDLRKKLDSIKRPDTDMKIFSTWNAELETLPGRLLNLEEVLEMYDRRVRTTVDGSRVWKEANIELLHTMHGIIQEGGPLAEEAAKVADTISFFGEKSEEADEALDNFRRQIKLVRFDDLGKQINETTLAQAGYVREMTKADSTIADTTTTLGRMLPAYKKAVISSEEAMDSWRGGEHALKGLAKTFVESMVDLNGLDLADSDEAFLEFIGTMNLTTQGVAKMVPLVISELARLREEAAKPMEFGSAEHEGLQRSAQVLRDDLASVRKQIEDIEKGWSDFVKPAEDAFGELSDLFGEAVDEISKGFTDNKVFDGFQDEIRRVNADIIMDETQKANAINDINARQARETVRILSDGLDDIETIHAEQLAIIDGYVKDTILSEEEGNKKKKELATDLLKTRRDLYKQATDILRGELDKAITTYQHYADKVKSIEDEIADLHRSAADSLRELDRRGMTDYQVYMDKRKEIAEKQAELESLRGDQSDAARERARELGREIDRLALDTAKQVEGEKKAGQEKAEIYETEATAINKSRAAIKAKTIELATQHEQQKAAAKDLESRYEAEATIIQNNMEEMERAFERYAGTVKKAITSGLEEAKTALIATLAEINKEIDGLSSRERRIELKTKVVDLEDELKMVEDTIKAREEGASATVINLKAKAFNLEKDLDAIEQEIDKQPAAEVEVDLILKQMRLQDELKEIQDKITGLLEEKETVISLTARVPELEAEIADINKKIEEQPEGVHKVGLEFRKDLLEQELQRVKDKIESLSEEAKININAADAENANQVLDDVEGSLDAVDKKRTSLKIDFSSASRALQEVEKLNQTKIQDKSFTVTKYEKTVQTKNSGGLIHGLNRGGPVPGQGIGDTVPAMLTPNEYVQPVPTVEKYGVGFMEALRKRIIPKEAIQELMTSVRSGIAKKPTMQFATGGQVTRPVVKFATGGQVTKQKTMAESTPVNFGTLTLSIGNDKFPMQAPLDVMEQLSASIRRQQLVRGN